MLCIENGEESGAILLYMMYLGCFSVTYRCIKIAPPPVPNRTAQLRSSTKRRRLLVQRKTAKNKA